MNNIGKGQLMTANECNTARELQVSRQVEVLTSSIDELQLRISRLIERLSIASRSQVPTEKCNKVPQPTILCNMAARFAELVEKVEAMNFGVQDQIDRLEF